MKKLTEGEGAPEAMAKSTSRIERELSEVRRALDADLSELDRRRRELTDWRLQARRHPRVLVGAGIGALVVVGGLVAAAVIARRRQRPRGKARQLRLALERSFAAPHKVARPEPGVALKVLAAIATSVGTMLARKYIEALWRNPPPRAPTFGSEPATPMQAASPSPSLH